ncbi:MAG TPA: hypothetical protein DCE23_02525 [Firmicutes bacterium]|nr:hypothetical protein [Bacillota bacterium]
MDELADALTSGGMIDNSEVSKGTLDLEKTGLTKDALRELIVASYVTQATRDTVVGIEIPEEEMNPILKGALDVYLFTDNAGLFQDALNVVINTFSDIRNTEQTIAILNKIVEEIVEINGHILDLEDITIM